MQLQDIEDEVIDYKVHLPSAPQKSPDNFGAFFVYLPFIFCIAGIRIVVYLHA